MLIKGLSKNSVVRITTKILDIGWTFSQIIKLLTIDPLQKLQKPRSIFKILLRLHGAGQCKGSTRCIVYGIGKIAQDFPPTLLLVARIKQIRHGIIKRFLLQF